MRKIILMYIYSFLIILTGISQNNSENILYIVDSVPIIYEPEEGFNILTPEQIDNIVVVKEKKEIEILGFKDLDGIIYVFTKEYVQRPDSIKIIPTTNRMERKNGKWYLKNIENPYSGKFIDYYLNGYKQGEGILFEGTLKGKRKLYYLNGNVSDVITYDNGISNGIEKQFYQNGTLKQCGELKNGKEIGIWEMFHPNGQLKQRNSFDKGKMIGESVTYYSTGKVKVKQTFINGVAQKDKKLEKIYKLYKEGLELDRIGSFKSSIKKYTKCIEHDNSFADAYFARGTAKLNNMQFDESTEDFNRTIEIEPYFVNAYGNRAFAIIRKYEFGQSRILTQNTEVTVLASKDNVEIPENERENICKDLSKAIALGDNNNMILVAKEKYCKE